METVSENRAFGGTQGVYTHQSSATGTKMTFGLFLPREADFAPAPLLWFLSGLTCTHENAMTKAGAQSWCAEQGIAMVFPDTSPRGEDVADDAEFDLGQGAGFYLDATKTPWAPHFAMESYIMDDLPALLGTNFAVDMDRQSVAGHSMGGHGALTLAMRHPDRFRSVSAFAPIANPTGSDWGRKQFEAYLGSVDAGADHDASRLIETRGLDLPLLVDTGTDDQFGDLLGTDRLAATLATRRCEATLRLQKGYDHSYFFISTFMDDHVAFHAEALWS